MAKNRVSMRDIAKYCGVSVATVSYALNHSTKENISHETRLRIMLAANELHYTPPTPSREKAALLHHKVAVVIYQPSGQSPEKYLVNYDLAAHLCRQLLQDDFQASLIPVSELNPDQSLPLDQSIDAVFLIDMPDTNIEALTKNYYVPLIFLNYKLPDPIFCKINPDYKAVAACAAQLLHTDEFFLLAYRPGSPAYGEELLRLFQPSSHLLVSHSDDPIDFITRHKGMKGIILGDLLGLKVLPYTEQGQTVTVSYLGDRNLFPADHKVLYVRNENIAAVGIETFKNMLAFEHFGGDENNVFIDYELE